MIKTFYQVVYCVKGVRPLVMVSCEDLATAQLNLQSYKEEQDSSIWQSFGKYKIKAKTVEFP